MGEMERTILALEKKWEETDKATLAANVKQLVEERYPGENYSKVVAKLTDTANIVTVYAWFNMSRENVKIPFLKLCRLLAELDTPMEEMLSK